MKDYLFFKAEKIKNRIEIHFLENQKLNEKEISSTMKISCNKDFKIDYNPDNIYFIKKDNVTEIKDKYYKIPRKFTRDCLILTKDKKSIIEEYLEYKKSVTTHFDHIDVSVGVKSKKSISLYESVINTINTIKPDVEKSGFYLDDNTWLILLRNISKKINTLITGPTGCGKTSCIKLACEKLGLPLSIYDMGSMFDPISGLLGVHRLEKGGKSIFDYAKFTQDIQKPGVILLDELSRASLNSNNILLPCLDDRRTLPVEIAGGKDVRSIKIHPDVCFIATANVGVEYTGTHIMDRALQDRFFPIELSYLPEKEEVKILSIRSNINKDISELIVKIASQIRSIYRKQEISTTISTRETLMVSDLVHDGWSLENALTNVILPIFDGSTNESERDIIKKIIMSY